TFLAPGLGFPPLPRCPLSLAIVENGYPVSVLQIICGADPALDIAAVGLAPPSEPGAALVPPPVSERKPLFEPAPVGLRPDRKTMPRRTGFEIRIAHRARHFDSSLVLGSFWGVYGGRW